MQYANVIRVALDICIQLKAIRASFRRYSKLMLIRKKAHIQTLLLFQSFLRDNLFHFISICIYYDCEASNARVVPPTQKYCHVLSRSG